MFHIQHMQVFLIILLWCCENPSSHETTDWVLKSTIPILKSFRILIFSFRNRNMIAFFVEFPMFWFVSFWNWSLCSRSNENINKKNSAFSRSFSLVDLYYSSPAQLPLLRKMWNVVNVVRSLNMGCSLLNRRCLILVMAVVQIHSIKITFPCANCSGQTVKKRQHALLAPVHCSLHHAGTPNSLLDSMVFQQTLKF